MSFERREILFFRHRLPANPVREGGGWVCPDPGRGAYLPHGRWRTPLYIEEHVFFVFDTLGCRDGWTEGSAGERARRSRRAESRAVSLGCNSTK